MSAHMLTFQFEKRTGRLYTLVKGSFYERTIVVVPLGITNVLFPAKIA